MSGAGQAGKEWCILRTAPRSTLGLARSLSEDGVAAWSPFEMVHTPKTRRRAAADLPAPIMPTFVFAPAECLPRLSLLRTDAAAKHPGFSIFRYAGRIPLIDGRSLEPLRKLEIKAAERHVALARRTASVPLFKPGQLVTSDDLSFQGLEGVVEEQKGRFVYVCFGGRYAFKVSAWLLQPNDVNPFVSAAA